MPFFEQYYSCWSSNSWYLTKILYPNGKFVNFKYKRGTLINQMYLSYKAKVTEDISYNNKPYNCYYNNNVPFNLENSYNGELISPIYLEEIEAPDFKIIFTTGSSYELRLV